MTKPLRVTWTGDEELRCAILAGMGMSTKFIMQETGLSACQISYRLKLAQIKRSHYRDGHSNMAKRLLNSIPTSKAAIRGIMELEVRKI